MGITTVTIRDQLKWDSIVKSFKNYDVYYLNGYAKSFYINGDGEPLLLYYEDNTIRAINIVMKRDIASCNYFKGVLETNKLFDLTSPYGYGGFLVESSQSSEVSNNQLDKCYSDYCIKENIVCEFVRFSPILNNWIGLQEVYDTTHLGNTVCIDTSNKENIWENMSSKNRNVIRKAQKSGVNVYWSRDNSIIPDFMEIYNETMKKDEADKYFYFNESFYNSILEDLKYNAMWFFAKNDNKIAAIAIFLYCNGNMHYHLSASRLEYKSIAPSNLLLYEAALWASNNGLKNLHLGGGVGSANDSLYKVKKAFYKGNDSEFHIGKKKIFLPGVYKELVQIRMRNSNIEANQFFPLYRAK